MKIKILDEILEIDNTLLETEKILKEVNKIINKSNLVLSKLIIDGNEIYTDFYKYVINTFENINEIEVVLNSKIELENEFLKSSYEYLEQLLPQLDLLAEEFLGNNETELWSKFANFLEGLDSITKMAIILSQRLNEETNIKIQKKLSEQIEALSEAVDNNDRILIRDLILYEIKPILQEFYDVL